MCPRRLLATLGLLTVLAAGLALSACNTVAGAGEDLNAAGRAVSNSADKVKSGQ